MEEQINLELLNLQEELTLLSAAVKHIEKAGTVSNKVIEAINQVQNDYGMHLQKITDKYEDYLEKAHQNSDSKIDELSNRHKAHIAEMRQITDNYLELAEATSQLPEEISKIDFPIRLDRIDENISNINEGILNTQQLIDSMERRLKSDYRRVGDLEKRIKSQNRKMNTMYVLVILSFLMTLGLIVTQILPKLM